VARQSGSRSRGRTNAKLAAALTICAAVAISALQDNFIKWISGDYPFHQMQTIRCLAAMPMIVFCFLWGEGISAMRTQRLGLVLLRSLILATASVMFYLTAAAMPFPEAVALYFTMPLFIAALAGPFLGESVRLYRWLAVTAGFGGVVVMLRPGVGVFEPASLFGLTSALLYAAGHMMTRPLGAVISAQTLALYQNIMYIAVALFLSAVFGWGWIDTDLHPSLYYLTRGWVWPSLPDVLFICFLGTTTGILMVIITVAYRLADSSFVAPFEYTAMFWAVLFSYLIFGHLPDLWAVTGIALVLGSGLFMLIMDRYTGSRAAH
jgi:drug/metabolite transporter (DMT)-like permease